MTQTENRLSVYSPDYDPMTGYGRMTLELIHHLNERGVTTAAFGGQKTTLVWPTQSASIQALIQRPALPSLGGILMGYPTIYPSYSALAARGPRVAVTMFESTKLPTKWMPILLQCDMVVVPTENQKAIFVRNGLPSQKVRAVPLGLSGSFAPAGEMFRERNTLPYPIKRRLVGGQLWWHRVENKPTADDPFVFLVYGDRGSRKAWEPTIQAFKQAFGDRDDVRLIIKSRGGGFGYLVHKLGGVEVINADMDEWSLLDLYLRCDAMVFPSYAEGFGLPPREFAATGGPAIVNPWWADNASSWAYPVKYDMVTAHVNEQFDGLGQWAAPDFDHLAHLMTHLMTQDVRVLQYMATRAAKYVRKNYRWDAFAQGVLQAWDDASKKRDKRSKRRRETA